MDTVIGAMLFVAVMGSAAGFVIWLHWPQRMGGLRSQADSDELDELIAEVGNVDRKRVPGESGSDGAEGFG